MEFNYRNGRPAVKKPLTFQDIQLPAQKWGRPCSGQDYGEKVE